MLRCLRAPIAQTWPDLVPDHSALGADTQCVTLSKYAIKVQARRRATAVRKAGLLDYALWLVHKNFSMSPNEFAQSLARAMAPARIDRVKMRDLAGWLFDVDQCDLLRLAQSNHR